MDKTRRGGFSLFSVVIVNLVIIVGIFSSWHPVFSDQKPAEAKKDFYFWGNSPYEQTVDWYRVLVKASDYYALDQGNKVINLNPNMIPEAQIRDIRYMLAQGVDGMMVCPTSLQGLSATIDLVVSKGIPVVTYDGDADTPNVLVNIRVSNSKIGELAAQGMVDAMKADGVQPKGKVLLISGSTTAASAMERRDGAKSVLSKLPNVEIVVYMIEAWSMADAKKNVVDAIAAWGPPLGIVACNASTGIGIMEALKTANVAIPRGKKGHVYTGVVDVEKPMKAFMHQGICDAGVDQPNLFYGTLAQYFLQKYIEEGESAIPPVGVTVYSDPKKPDGLQPDGTWNIYLKGNVHEGVDFYKYPSWAPATVIENYGHRWLQVSPAIVTPENVEELPIWSNVVSKWLQ